MRQYTQGKGLPYVDQQELACNASECAVLDEDGQTLGELSARLPGMTRFGVMKHLRILESAGLVTSRKVGRERLHYLNPVPINEIYERWIGKYERGRLHALDALKTALGSEHHG